MSDETTQAFKDAVQESEDIATSTTLVRELDVEPVLRWFAFDHLPKPLRDHSRPFAQLAARVVSTLPRSRERTKALDRLLESKDAAVRTAMLLGLVLMLGACVCSVEPPPAVSFCARLESYACPNAQCDERGEPTADRCDLAQVEACVSEIEASPSCYEAGGVASSELCTTACASIGGAP